MKLEFHFVEEIYDAELSSCESEVSSLTVQSATSKFKLMRNMPSFTNQV